MNARLSVSGFRRASTLPREVSGEVVSEFCHIYLQHSNPQGYVHFRDKEIVNIPDNVMFRRGIPLRVPLLQLPMSQRQNQDTRKGHPYKS